MADYKIRKMNPEELEKVKALTPENWADITPTSTSI
jgi:hypothetical protein